ncbi:hypothetical protein OG705_29195 [Streptomyces sp. NBC_00838]|uniref:hypothetical protein n=1 Tax=Streptomyces sp. NBC_00838 TaxID=2903680 RepID=UPI00386759FD|nr:hypothetical protein OG705_29195 [Streptomyces sp. NBC_00838]
MFLQEDGTPAEGAVYDTASGPSRTYPIDRLTLILVIIQISHEVESAAEERDDAYVAEKKLSRGRTQRISTTTSAAGSTWRDRAAKTIGRVLLTLMIGTNVIVLAPAAVFCVMTGQYTPIIISIAFSGLCWWIFLRALRAHAENTAKTPAGTPGGGLPFSHAQPRLLTPSQSAVHSLPKGLLNHMVSNRQAILNGLTGGGQGEGIG